MKARTKFLLTLVILLTVVAYSIPAKAATGLPESPKFGYGARLDIWGQYTALAIETAAKLGLDWIGIDFDWAQHCPEPFSCLEPVVVSQAIQIAQKNNLSVLLSINNPPNWAITPKGPDALLTNNLVLELIGQYPGIVSAIELFPGVNTAQGWNAPPNPRAYLTILQSIQSSLNEAGHQVYLITTLTPVSPGNLIGDFDDLVFLDTLYKLGAISSMPIIGIRYREVIGDPLSPPNFDQRNTLRYYESVRAVMLQNNHQYGLLWITGFSWPSEIGDQGTNSTEQQTLWLERAYQLLKAQLFIGSALFTQLNPPAQTASSMGSASLIMSDFSLHPACKQIAELINDTSLPTKSGPNLSVDSSAITNSPSDVNCHRLKKISPKRDFKTQ